MAEHSRGPWTINVDAPAKLHLDRIYASIDSALSTGIATIRTIDEAEANARLIAAAPELLEALEMVYERLMDYPEVQRRDPLYDFVGFSVTTAKRIAPAIARARGGHQWSTC